MQENDFWIIIENAGSPDAFEPEELCERISNALLITTEAQPASASVLALMVFWCM